MDEKRAIKMVERILIRLGLSFALLVWKQNQVNKR